MNLTCVYLSTWAAMAAQSAGGPSSDCALANPYETTKMQETAASKRLMTLPQPNKLANLLEERQPRLTLSTDCNDGPPETSTAVGSTRPDSNVCVRWAPWESSDTGPAPAKRKQELEPQLTGRATGLATSFTKQ